MRSIPAAAVLGLVVLGSWSGLPAQEASDAADRPGVTDWLEYRGGPFNRGVSFSARPDYSEVKWRYFTGDRSTSSPAVCDGRVIVATETGRVHAIDAGTGRKIWVATCGQGEKGKGFVISSPMIMDLSTPERRDRRIYVGCLDGKLYCLDLETGTERWAFDAKDEIYASPKGDHRGIVIGTKEGWMHCIDPLSGKLRWQHRALRDVGASAAIMGSKVYLPSKDKRLYRFELDTGKDLGYVDLPGGTHCAPCLGAGFAFMVFTGRKCGAFDLFKNELAWHDLATSDIKTSCAYAERTAIMPLGRYVWAMNAATGEKLWEVDAVGRVGTPVINSGEVVFVTNDGILRVHDLRDGEEVLRMILGEEVFAAPTIAGGDVFVAGLEGHVYAIQ